MPWHGDNSTADKSQLAAYTLHLRIGHLELNTTHNTPPRAHVHKDTFKDIHEDKFDESDGLDEIQYLFAHSNPQSLVAVAWDDSVPVGIVLLSEIDRLNFEVCEGSTDQFCVYNTELAPLPLLSEIIVECRPRWPSRKESTTEAAQPQLTDMNVESAQQALSKMLFSYPVSQFQKFLLVVDGVSFVVRLLELLSDHDDDGETEFVLNDTFHGLVDEGTHVVFVEDKNIRLTHTHHNSRLVSADTSMSPSVVDVTTADDELFPVKKRLLLPCISLASACVAEGHQTVRVDVRSDIFDRVLLFLEAEILAEAKLGPPYEVDAEHTQDLLSAGVVLGCQALIDVCKAKLGEFVKRVRKNGIAFNEVVERNRRGETILVIDGMVFDVSRWLPNHPGGSTIIPEQGLNLDAIGFFEVYHSSRASFRYLKQFYIGDVTDKEAVPKPHHEASEAFVDQLRTYTTWRVTPVNPVYKSF